MHVLYLYQYFVAREGHGMTRAYEFARRIIENGHQVTVVTLPGYLPDEYKNFRKTTRVVIESVPTIIIPVAYSNHMSFRRRILAFAQFAVLASIVCSRTHADVIYASSGPLTIMIPAIIGKLFQRIPMVFEVRDLWPRMPIALGVLKDPFTKAVAHAMEWLAYHSASHVVALSPGMAAGVHKRGIRQDRITVIPNSSDVDLFDVPAVTGQSVRDKLGIDSGTPLITYTGSFGWMYNLSYLIDIADVMRSVVPSCCFLLIGAGAEFDKIVDKAKQSGLLNQTVFVWEAAPKTEMPAILSAATATISVTMAIKEFEDNSANKFFDSLAAGRPIVINYGGWQADLLAESGAGIQIPEEDPQQAAQLIAQFILDEDKINTARQSAKELAYTRFNRDNMAQKLVRLLETEVSK